MYATAFPDGKVEVTNVLGSGNNAFCEFVARGTHNGDLKGIAPTGKAVEIHAANAMELRDGKVYREREYFDLMTLMVQIGAVPSSGS